MYLTNRLPTAQMYEELQQAYDHFNDDLFSREYGKSLPGAMITLQRKHGTMAYFSASRWSKNEKNPESILKRADEIALNPAFITVKSIEETLQSLVHQMGHQYQYHFGKPGRGRYHNAELASIMEGIGLILSDTGKPGGKSTGDSVSEYKIIDGKFDLSTKKLLTRKFAISWLDRFPVTRKELADTLHQHVEETGICLSEEEIKHLDIHIIEKQQKKNQQ
ncbi:hypothetical protein JAB4_059220 (plasmid) [Janthinobacterium sp. HH102]|uniref:SprT-like domain-containing protein n=1 Tax=Janthinobacterium sp. HH102 TaxID=1537274 RepID=UPI0008931F9F|nr:SprT-like domain-containing protein [Janthinobacterium sp. HH102]QOU76422.1 hypothetical protein JAB4_059220 [Janthinobacterium sp. HH102]